MHNKLSAADVYKKFCSAAVLFTLCGFCGWIYETTLTSYLWGRFAERGFLHIPVLPIYGVFAFIMLPLFKKHNGWFTVFFCGMGITTALEFVSSYIIEWTIHEKLWSYSSWDFNFQGRISLYSSLIFGVLSLMLIKCAYPLVKYFSIKSPRWLVITIGTFCTSTVIFDFIVCLVLKK